MENAQTYDLLGLLVLVAGSFAVLVYVFLRMAGGIGRNAQRRGRPPPPTSFG
jgi:hypothetical protein